jgi:hypothetical protein
MTLLALIFVSSLLALDCLNRDRLTVWRYGLRAVVMGLVMALVNQAGQ